VHPDEVGRSFVSCDDILSRLLKGVSSDGDRSLSLSLALTEEGGWRERAGQGEKLAELHVELLIVMRVRECVGCSVMKRPSAVADAEQG